MDEPTSSLTENETRHLFKIIRQLQAKGCAIIYISHKMEEILKISDEVTIMRDGQYIGSWPASQLTTDEIINRMVGRELTNRFPPKDTVPGTEVVLQVKDLCSAAPRSFRHISFELHRGEILGLGGLVGAQRTELVESVFGLRPIASGEIYKNGKKIEIRRVSDAKRNGLALLTEERRASGVFAHLSVLDNTVIASQRRFASRGVLNGARRYAAAKKISKELNVKTPNLETEMENLSGGNQQKVLFSRWLLTEPDILIVFGILFRAAFYTPAVYDPPSFIAYIGAGVFIYGVVQMARREKLGDEVSFSGGRAKTFFLNNALIFALLIMVVVVAIISPNFVKNDVLLDILSQSPIRLIIAIGIVMTLLIAGTDLSAGRMVGLAAVISTSMLQNPAYANRFYPNLPWLPVIVPILTAILVCGLFGMLNGFLVAKYNMHPFIATLATQVMIYGACSLYFDMPPNSSQPIGGVRDDFTIIAQKKLFGTVSILIPIALVVTFAMWFVLNKTVFGKNISAVCQIDLFFGIRRF